MKLKRAFERADFFFVISLVDKQFVQFRGQRRGAALPPFAIIALRIGYGYYCETPKRTDESDARRWTGPLRCELQVTA